MVDMTIDDMIDAANRAWIDGHMDLWATQLWLLKTLYGIDHDAGSDLQKDKDDERNGDWTR